MKLNQKILKAINEGIRKSLLSFEDIEFDKSKSNSVNQKVTKSIEDWKWIQDNFVDLGLPSGTLWCKYNLGATNEDTAESWYGYYYMWGSTKSNDNDNCCWRNAPFNNGNGDFDREYSNEHMYEFIDHDGNLLLEYDIAYRIDDRMHMPTTEQIQELDKETEHCWIEDYNGVNGLNGQLFTGKNDNALFIPAAGWRYRDDCHNDGFSCHLWSSSLNVDNPFYAYILYFSSSNFSSSYHDNRSTGQSVRGVI